MTASALAAVAVEGARRLLARFAVDLGVEYTSLYPVVDGVVSTAFISVAPDPQRDADLEIVARAIERNSLVMSEDITHDAVTAAAEPAGTAATGAILALPAMSQAGETLGVLIARSAAPRSWTNQDLERSDDIVRTIASLLMTDRLRRVAEARLEFEELRRKLRVHLHAIAAQAASATTLDQLAMILVTNSPAIVGAEWGVSLVRNSGESDWVFESDGADDALVAELRAAQAAGGESALSTDDRVSTIDVDELAAHPELRQSLVEGGIACLVRLDLASATADLDAVLYLGVRTALGEYTMLLAEELADDAHRAVDRVARTQQQSRIAVTLQRSLLPPRVPQVEGFEIRQLYNSAADFTRVGGDWYDVVTVDDTRTAFVVGDVAGHDLRSAAVMGQLRHVVASQLRDQRTPAGTLQATDRYFSDLAENVMATVVVVQVDRERSTASICLAGHPPPVVIGEGRAHLLDARPGPPVGFGFGGYTDTEIALRRGTTLVAYTDGLVERREGSLADHLQELVTALAGVSASIDALAEFLRAHAASGSLVDDVAALIVRYSP